jgi:hypothetical protein
VAVVSEVGVSPIEGLPGSAAGHSFRQTLFARPMRFPSILFGALLMSLWPTSTGQGSERWLDTRRWTQHRWPAHGISARLPEGLQVRATGAGGLRVTHAVPLRHRDPCDGPSDYVAYARSVLVDLDLRLDVLPLPRAAAVRRFFTSWSDTTEWREGLPRGMRELRVGPHDAWRFDPDRPYCVFVTTVIELDPQRTVIARYARSAALATSGNYALKLTPAEMDDLRARAIATRRTIPLPVADSIVELVLQTLDTVPLRRVLP